MNIVAKISQELNLTKDQIKSVFSLFDDGATVPFIARYRKEHTGGLDEEQLREIEDRRNYLIILEDRKKTVLESIEEQGKLTDELKNKIIAAEKLREVEDLYLPYKPKRKTRATVAIAKGLEPLADFILENPQFTGRLEEEAEKYIDEEKEVATAEEAIQGAKDIIAERISENAEVRQLVRDFMLEEAKLVSKKSNTKKEDLDKNKKDVYEVYYNFEADVKKIKPYQVLAINRGEKEKF
ncbi:MAG: Tex-like N-terminal domain-containing protein [Melioribacteraceae bacterium]|nr:Tex-like N-terminal domain-containing protein [Melioribacteraceae bacterium]